MPTWRPLASEFGGSLWAIAKVSGVFHIITSYGIDTTTLVGPSMMPTFRVTGDVVLVDKLSVKLRWYKRGDVVVSRSPSDAGQWVAKRILALPGDEVVWSPPFSSDSTKEVTVVPDGHVWLEGDNSLNSTDSRQYGPIPCSLLLGRVFFLIWPFELVKRVTNVAPHEEDQYFNETQHPSMTKERFEERKEKRSAVVYRSPGALGPQLPDFTRAFRAKGVAVEDQKDHQLKR